MAEGPGMNYEEDGQDWMMGSSNMFYKVSIAAWISPLLALAVAGGMWKWGSSDSELNALTSEDTNAGY